MCSNSASEKKLLDGQMEERGILSCDSTQHASRVGGFPADDDANQAGSFSFETMPSAFSYEEQIDRLESRGLIVGDKESAIRILSEVNYYRLRGYWLTLEEGHDRFRDGMTFETIVDVYSLDKELRDWLWRAIEPVEVKLRTSFAYRTGFALGPGGYADSQHYQNKKAHEKSMKSYRREVSRAQRDGVPCVCHNLGKYGALPVWAAVEVMSMGTLSRLYGNLKSSSHIGRGGDIKAEIAGDFGMKPGYLEGWLRHLTYVRNICAHHNRFYNRITTVRPKLLRKDAAFAKGGKQFMTFVVLERIYERSWPDRWAEMVGQLDALIKSHQAVDITRIGFPDGWREVLTLRLVGQKGELGRNGWPSRAHIQPRCALVTRQPPER